jgi:hypothetical protein
MNDRVKKHSPSGSEGASKIALLLMRRKLRSAHAHSMVPGGLGAMP